MGRVREWTSSEIKVLIDNYNTKTIQELLNLIPNRSQESINNKIKRLKKSGKIRGGKEDDVVQRAYEQRGKDVI